MSELMQNANTNLKKLENMLLSVQKNWAKGLMK